MAVHLDVRPLCRGFSPQYHTYLNHVPRGDDCFSRVTFETIKQDKGPLHRALGRQKLRLTDDLIVSPTAGSKKMLRRECLLNLDFCEALSD